MAFLILPGGFRLPTAREHNREKKLRHDKLSRHFFMSNLSNLVAILVEILVAKAITGVSRIFFWGGQVIQNKKKISNFFVFITMDLQHYIHKNQLFQLPPFLGSHNIRCETANKHLGFSIDN